jgi:ATP-binding cassette subfamily F protein 2
VRYVLQLLFSCLSAGTYANLVRQAKSRQKILDKMEADGLVEKVEKMNAFSFSFNGSGPLPPPVLSFNQMTFSYTGELKDSIYENLDMGIDTESRVALVGPNGAGKSTLLKLMTGELTPLSGQITRHTRLKLCKYNQHSADQLDLTKSAIEYLRDKFPDEPRDISYWRSQVGRFGLTGGNQLCPIGNLSDGQKSRIVFCELSLARPTVLLLDEPTNALDIVALLLLVVTANAQETIDSLAEAIRDFNGGVVLVSHDFRLISQVAEEIWVCENKVFIILSQLSADSQTVTPWKGTIGEYKDHLKKEVIRD